MSTPKRPNIWVELILTKYPASEGVDIYRWARRPMADPSSWKEGRLISLGSISRTASDTDGNYEVSRARVTLTDADGFFRGLLAVSTTRYMLNRECGIFMLSDEGREAGIEPITLFRGWVTDIQLMPGRQFSLEISDVVGSQYSRFNLERIINVPLGAEHTALPESSKGLYYPMIVGEHTDVGLLNANGEAADVGKLPVYDTGDYDPFGGAVPTPLSAPTGFWVNVHGTTGHKTVTYAVSTGTANGESRYCTPITVTNAYDGDFDSNNYVEMGWDEVPGAAFYRVWGRTSNPPTTWLDGMNNGNTFVNPETYYRDDQDHDIQKSMAIPQTDTSQASDRIYGRLVVSIGALAAVQAVYVSNLADGTTPQRVRAGDDLYGTYILAPGHPGWPHPENYVEIGGIRMTVIYVRGPYLQHHRDGVVTIAVNACGYEEFGDGTGNVIDQAFKAGQFFINEFILKNRGTGYRIGEWGPLEEYDNGDAILMTSEWENAQDISIGYVGGSGYLAAWAIHDQMTVRDFVQKFCLTFNCRLGPTRHGQIRPIIIDDSADHSTWKHLRDRIEIKQLQDQQLLTAAMENSIEYSYDWVADQQVYRTEGLVLQDLNAIAANAPGAVSGDGNMGGLLQRDRQELFCTNDANTALDTRHRRLGMNRWMPRYSSILVDMSGITLDLGTGLRITHYDGLGDGGDTETPMIVVGMAINPDTLDVLLTMLDVSLLPHSSESTSASATPSPSSSISASPSPSPFQSHSRSPSHSVSPSEPLDTDDFLYNRASQNIYSGPDDPIVVKVTNLNDSGLGSLRYALEDISVPRVVVFEISGYIDLHDTIRITNPYVWIAGQTAPSPGVTVRVFGFEISTHDVFFQHFAVRNGEFGQLATYGVQDICGIIAFGNDAYDITVANMSVSWGIDENIAADKYGTGTPMNMLIYRCISAENLNGPTSFPGSASHGVLIMPQSHYVIMYQTLMSTNVERNPYTQGDTTTIFVNNVTYNWLSVWSYFYNNYALSQSETVPAGPWYSTVVKNVLRPGPNTDDDGGSPEAYQFYYDHAPSGGAQMTGNQIYREGNIWSNPLGKTEIEEGNEMGYDPNVGTPVSGLEIPAGMDVLDAADVEDFVYAHSGARPGDRDEVDTRIIADAEACTTTAGYISHQNAVGGFPSLAVNTRTLTIPSDPHADSGNGFTNLEMWLQDYAATVE